MIGDIREEQKVTLDDIESLNASIRVMQDGQQTDFDPRGTPENPQHRDPLESLAPMDEVNQVQECGGIGGGRNSGSVFFGHFDPLD